MTLFETNWMGRILLLGIGCLSLTFVLSAYSPSAKESHEPLREAQEIPEVPAVSAAEHQEQNQEEAIPAIEDFSNLNSPVLFINKEHHLPADYIPPDLVEPAIPFSFEGTSPKKLMRKEAAKAIEELFAHAQKDGIPLAGVSAYRSYDLQESIYQGNVRALGQEEAEKWSARPGESEHQTGLAIDISTAEMGFLLEESFAETKEGKWLAEHAPLHGFIIRYPKGKEALTGYSYEPWHIRYVGKKAAKEISERGVSLEEYVNELTLNKGVPRK